MENNAEILIPEPKGCVVCGVDTGGFSVCVECGVQMFMHDNSGEPMKECKEQNPERFKMLIAWYEQKSQLKAETK